MRGSRCDSRSLSRRSPFALLVDAHLEGVAVGSHGAQRVVRWHYLGSGGGQQAGAPGGCSCRQPARSTHAGVTGAAAGPPTAGRKTAPQSNCPGVIPAGTQRHPTTPMAPRVARTRAPGVAAAEGVVARDDHSLTARRTGRREREHRAVPSTAGRSPFTCGCCSSVPVRPPSRSRAASGCTACGAALPHHRITAQPAVHDPTPIAESRFQRRLARLAGPPDAQALVPDQVGV